MKLFAHVISIGTLVAIGMWLTIDVAHAFNVAIDRSGFYTGSRCGQIGERVNAIEIPYDDENGGKVNAPFCLTGTVNAADVTRGSIKVRIYDDDPEFFDADELLKEESLSLPEGTETGNTVALSTNINLGCTTEGKVVNSDGESAVGSYFWVESASPQYPYFGYNRNSYFPIRCVQKCPGCGGVGGIAELPDIEALPVEKNEQSARNLAPYIAGGVGAAIIIVATLSWYIRRRRL